MQRSDAKNVDIKIETINPEKAKEYLELNKKNRHITRYHLLGLVHEMKERRWIFNGDPIRFNGNTLIDGQHRLMAVIESDTAQEFVVIRQLSNAAFETIDTGRRRSTSDFLSIGGEHYPIAISSGLRWLTAWKRFKNFNSKEPIPNTEKLSFLQEYTEVRQLIIGYAGGKSPLRMSPGMLGTCHLLLREKNKKSADQYMDQLTTGIELKIGDPAYTVRQWIIKRPAGSNYKFTTQAGHLIIRGWNSWRQDERLTMLKNVDMVPTEII